jgi:hypothetical protein
MTPVELAARYRGYAIRCLLIEKHQFNVSDKEALADIAKALASLADCVEKNEAAFALIGSAGLRAAPLSCRRGGRPA